MKAKELYNLYGEKLKNPNTRNEAVRDIVNVFWDDLKHLIEVRNITTDAGLHNVLKELNQKGNAFANMFNPTILRRDWWMTAYKNVMRKEQEKMNRDILFRGKRVDNGEWAYGYYIQHFTRQACIIGDDCLKENEIKHLIAFDGFSDWNMPRSIEAIEVIPETVGQYTGSPDENGKKIFEGDIVRVNIKGHNTICIVSWAGVVAQFQLWQVNRLENTPTNLNLGNYATVVIGNIHDDPELIEECEKE